MIRRATIAILMLLSVRTTAHAEEAFAPYTHAFPPFYIETDVGETDSQKKAYAQKFARHITNTGNFFLKVYSLTSTCFEDYAKYFDPTLKDYDTRIRIRLFRKYSTFLEDFQTRYKTKTIPGAFFGWHKRDVDEYGKDKGMRFREIATAVEASTDEQILRHLYHEMGHLFMRTYITYEVEVPSWMEEGTAELFQMREGNGTHPERERSERAAWMAEIINEASNIPWPEFIKVHNLDNLDFTWKDPMRSTIQYTQAWSVMEFMLSTPARNQAYSKMLDTFKKAALAELQAAWAAGLREQAFYDRTHPFLYTVQEKIFKESYGADLVSIEGKWKEWVNKNFDKEVARKPAVRYHRGAWQLMRSNYAKSKDEREACLAKAEKIFNECAADDEKMPEAYVGLGRVAMARGDFKTSNDKFAKALELGTDNYDALLYGGIAMVLNGKAADAVAGLMKAAEQVPTDYEVNYFLGLAMAMSKGKPEEALTYLRRARDLKQDRTAQCALVEGMVQYNSGKLGEAYISFLRASNQMPNDPVIPLLMAVLKAQNNEKDEALDILSRAKDNPFAEALTAAIKANQKMPRLVFNRMGMPQVEGLTIESDEQAAKKKAEADKKKAEGEKKPDFGDAGGEGEKKSDGEKKPDSTEKPDPEKLFGDP